MDHIHDAFAAKNLLRTGVEGKINFVLSGQGPAEFTGNLLLLRQGSGCLTSSQRFDDF